MTPLALVLLAASAARPATSDLPAALAAADAADLRLRREGTCAASDLSLVSRATSLVHDASGPPPSLARWAFPLRGLDPASSIGGRHGEGYRAAHPRRCFAIANSGHPAQDLFVRDPERDSLDARGRPFVVQAVEDGTILVIRTGWLPGNPLKGGNYVVEYLPSRRQLAYYAHLDRVSVRPGQRVAAGDELGTLGRTGVNAYRSRSPTHLHFALWDVGALTPVNPYSLLVAASY